MAVSVRWCALSYIQRRVAGVLVEKSKTTPDIYPMTLNGIKTASNQKSNRSPQLDLREDQVEQALYDLRELGAVVEVHSGGACAEIQAPVIRVDGSQCGGTRCDGRIVTPRRTNTW